MKNYRIGSELVIHWPMNASSSLQPKLLIIFKCNTASMRVVCDQKCLCNSTFCTSLGLKILSLHSTDQIIHLKRKVNQNHTHSLKNQFQGNYYHNNVFPSIKKYSLYCNYSYGYSQSYVIHNKYIVFYPNLNM